VSIGAPEILVVLVVALVVLGPQRLPQAARQLGKGLAEIKRISAGVQDQVQDALRVDEPVPDRQDEPPAPRPGRKEAGTDGFSLIDGSVTADDAGADGEVEPPIAPRRELPADGDGPRT